MDDCNCYCSNLDTKKGEIKAIMQLNVAIV